MKNRITIIALLIWTLCAFVGSIFFSTATNSPQAKSIENLTIGQGEVQFTSDISHNGYDVYGSATVTEVTPSNLSYRITITVTSASGRTNTTSSDWSPVPITHTTGLSIGDEDGIYNLEAMLETQNGRYDDYLNFDREGNSAVIATLTESLNVPPLITLANLIFTSPTIPAVAGNTSNLIATVNYSDSVPENTTVDIELNDSITGVGNPLYILDPIRFDPTNAGVATGTRNRTARLRVPAANNNPRSARLTFPFILSQNTGSGTVNANVRMGKVIPQPPSPSPTIQVVPPLGLNAVLTISPTTFANNISNTWRRRQ